MQTETEVEPVDKLDRLDRKAAAILLQVSVSTIRRWADAGIIPKPFIQMKRKRYWTRKQLESISHRKWFKVVQSGSPH